MKKLKKHIEENRELFDNKEPSAGHMERFEALLDKQQTNKEVIQEKQIHKPKRAKLIRTFSIAASIAILVVAAIKFYNPQSINTSVPVEENTILDEFMATNQYYNQQMEDQISDIMCKLAYTDSEDQEELNTDIQRILERNADFVNEMANNENQEIAIHYLVKHYQSNIEALENINEKLGKYTKC